MSLIEVFQEEHPSLDSYWRSIILFGRNVASYKFALAKSLLEITTTGKTVLTLEELAVPFSRNLCEHLFNSPKQATSDTSQFLDVCKKFNDGAATHDQLIETTVAKGFNNVIDAFKYGDYEGARNGRYFIDLTEESMVRILSEVPGLNILETWITGDVREGRASELWLNMLLKADNL